MNDFQQLGVGQQGQPFQPELAPQGFFGSAFGAPLGGLIGRGIGSLFGNAQLGGQIGQAAGDIGGGFLPLSADPYQQQLQQQLQQQQLQHQQLQQLAQQQAQGQLSPQGWFGSALSHIGRPLGGLIGGLAGNQQLGSTIGGIASQVGGMLPFSADLYQMQQLAQQQQGQVTPQGWLASRLPFLTTLPQFNKPLGSMISDTIPPGGPGGFLPFGFNPSQQQPQQGQQGQLAPQGWFGSAIGQIGKPLGGFIGGLAGNQQLGSTIGGIASQLGGMLPFSAGPQQLPQQLPQQPQQQFQQGQPHEQAQLQQVQQMQQLHQLIQHLQQLQQAQQAQQQGQVAPQGWVGNALQQLGQPVGSFIGGLAGNQQLGSTIGGLASQLGGMLPFSVDPYQMQQLAQQQQQGQLAPQGWFGSALSQIGKPLGGFIGGLAGNQQLGSTIGGVASQLGGMLPFSADPYQLQQLQQLQQLAQLQQQQAQLQQQQGQQLQPGQYPVSSTPSAQGNTVH